jgi:hypothetical protein
MAQRKILVLAASAVALTACAPLEQLGAHKPAGPLSKAEIEACLANPHKVGDDLVSPKPQPHHIFKPGYNFTVKMPDGSYGFGYEEASDGHLLVKYPEHGASFDYGVARSNGIVYFGGKATNCE